MKIEILEFFPDRKGTRVGFVDFRITHSENKEETFRGVGYFVKETKKWLSTPCVERNNKWLPRYERKPPLQSIFHQVIEELEIDIKRKSVFSDENN